MEQIIIGFSRPKKWKLFAHLIMWAYDTPYDHVYIRIHSDYYQRDLIYQASGLAVNFMSPDIFQADNEIIREFNFDIEKDIKVKTMQFAIDRAGVPYGMKDILGLAWVCVSAKLGKTIKNPFNDGEATYVCCELAGEVAQKYLKVELSKDLNDITPKDLFDILEKSN